MSVLIIGVRALSVLLHSLLHFGPSTADRLRHPRLRNKHPIEEKLSGRRDLTSATWDFPVVSLQTPLSRQWQLILISHTCNRGLPETEPLKLKPYTKLLKLTLFSFPNNQVCDFERLFSMRSIRHQIRRLAR